MARNFFTGAKVLTSQNAKYDFNHKIKILAGLMARGEWNLDFYKKPKRKVVKGLMETNFGKRIIKNRQFPLEERIQRNRLAAVIFILRP